jgi:hypothetical protein
VVTTPPPRTGPVSSGIDADMRESRWVIAGRPAHEFTAEDLDELFCRVCAGVRGGVVHPPPGAYSRPREVVLVNAGLTEPQFRHVGELLGTNLGRRVAGPDGYAFEPRTERAADALCAWLRGERLPHERETTRRWEPPAPARPAVHTDLADRAELITHLHNHPDHGYRRGHEFVLISTADIQDQHRAWHAQAGRPDHEVVA